MINAQDLADAFNAQYGRDYAQVVNDDMVFLPSAGDFKITGNNDSNDNDKINLEYWIVNVKNENRMLDKLDNATTAEAVDFMFDISFKRMR